MHPACTLWVPPDCDENVPLPLVIYRSWYSLRTRPFDMLKRYLVGWFCGGYTSFFDIDSTRRFLKHLQDIKRIRKGKVQILLLANRVKPNSASSKDIQDFFQKIEQQPVAWISERAAYGQLAMQGLSIFDKTQKTYLQMQDQWQPVLIAIVDDPSQWF